MICFIIWRATLVSKPSLFEWRQVPRKIPDVCFKIHCCPEWKTGNIRHCTTEDRRAGSWSVTRGGLQWHIIEIIYHTLGNGVLLRSYAPSPQLWNSSFGDAQMQPWVPLGCCLTAAITWWHSSFKMSALVHSKSLQEDW